MADESTRKEITLPNQQVIYGYDEFDKNKSAQLTLLDELTNVPIEDIDPLGKAKDIVYVYETFDVTVQDFLAALDLVPTIVVDDANPATTDPSVADIQHFIFRKNGNFYIFDNYDGKHFYFKTLAEAVYIGGENSNETLQNMADSRGVAGGIATLGADGLVKDGQLPKATTLVAGIVSLADELTTGTISSTRAPTTKLLNDIKAGLDAALKAHIETTGEGVHGSSVDATASAIIIRDADGRAKVADPVDGEDISNKQYVDSQISSNTQKASAEDMFEGTNNSKLVTPQSAKYLTPEYVTGSYDEDSQGVSITTQRILPPTATNQEMIMLYLWQAGDIGEHKDVNTVSLALGGQTLAFPMLEPALISSHQIYLVAINRGSGFASIVNAAEAPLNLDDFVLTGQYTRYTEFDTIEWDDSAKVITIIKQRPPSEIEHGFMVKFISTFDTERDDEWFLRVQFEGDDVYSVNYSIKNIALREDQVYTLIYVDTENTFIVMQGDAQSVQGYTIEDLMNLEKAHYRWYGSAETAGFSTINNTLTFSFYDTDLAEIPDDFRISFRCLVDYKRAEYTGVSATTVQFYLADSETVTLPAYFSYSQGEISAPVTFLQYGAVYVFRRVGDVLILESADANSLQGYTVDQLALYDEVDQSLFYNTITDVVNSGTIPNVFVDVTFEDDSIRSLNSTMMLSFVPDRNISVSSNATLRLSITNGTETITGNAVYSVDLDSATPLTTAAPITELNANYIYSFRLAVSVETGDPFFMLVNSNVAGSGGGGYKEVTIDSQIDLSDIGKWFYENIPIDEVGVRYHINLAGGFIDNASNIGYLNFREVLYVTAFRMFEEPATLTEQIYPVRVDITGFSSGINEFGSISRLRNRNYVYGRHFTDPGQYLKQEGYAAASWQDVISLKKQISDVEDAVTIPTIEINASNVSLNTLPNLLISNMTGAKNGVKYTVRFGPQTSITDDLWGLFAEGGPGASSIDCRVWYDEIIGRYAYVFEFTGGTNVNGSQIRTARKRFDSSGTWEPTDTGNPSATLTDINAINSETGAYVGKTIEITEQRPSLKNRLGVILKDIGLQDKPLVPFSILFQNGVTDDIWNVFGNNDVYRSPVLCRAYFSGWTGTPAAFGYTVEFYGQKNSTSTYCYAHALYNRDTGALVSSTGPYATDSDISTINTTLATHDSKLDVLNSGQQEHTSNTTIHVTAADKDKWNTSAEEAGIKTISINTANLSWSRVGQILVEQIDKNDINVPYAVKFIAGSVNDVFLGDESYNFNPATCHYVASYSGVTAPQGSSFAYRFSILGSSASGNEVVTRADILYNSIGTMFAKGGPYALWADVSAAGNDLVDLWNNFYNLKHQIFYEYPIIMTPVNEYIVANFTMDGWSPTSNGRWMQSISVPGMKEEYSPEVTFVRSNPDTTDDNTSNLRNEAWANIFAVESSDGELIFYSYSRFVNSDMVLHVSTPIKTGDYTSINGMPE